MDTNELRLHAEKFTRETDRTAMIGCADMIDQLRRAIQAAHFINQSLKEDREGLLQTIEQLRARIEEMKHEQKTVIEDIICGSS